jgi:hypothetical protein
MLALFTSIKSQLSVAKAMANRATAMMEVEMVQKYWICYLVTGIFKQFHGTDIGCVR